MTLRSIQTHHVHKLWWFRKQPTDLWSEFSGLNHPGAPLKTPDLDSTFGGREERTSPALGRFSAAGICENAGFVWPGQELKVVDQRTRGRI